MFLANPAQDQWPTAPAAGVIAPVRSAAAGAPDVPGVVIGTIAVGAAPAAVAVSGISLYVANSGSKSVSVISTKTNKVVGSPITVGASPAAVAVSGDSLIVANTGSNTVTVISTKTNKVVGSPITVGATPRAVAVTGKILYVANTGSNTVTVINTAATNTAPVVGAPAYTFTTLNPDTGRVDGVLRVTDPNGDPLTYTSPVTSSKGGTAVVSPAGAFVYTPTPAARHIASAVTATPADKLDAFTVRVSDGRGGTTSVTVSAVPISPSNDAPTSAGPTVGSPNAAGVVTGSLNVTDPTGLTAGPDVDAFTVTIGDGHGGVVPTVENVTVSPTHTTITGFIGLDYKVWAVS